MHVCLKNVELTSYEAEETDEVRTVVEDVNTKEKYQDEDVANDIKEETVAKAKALYEDSEAQEETVIYGRGLLPPHLEDMYHEESERYFESVRDKYSSGGAKIHLSMVTGLSLVLYILTF